MKIFAIIPGIFCFITLVLGTTFSAVARHLAGMRDRETTGEVVDLTRNASRYNREAQPEAEGKAVEDYVHIRVGNTRETSSYHRVFTYTVNGQTYTRADVISYSSALAKKWLGRTVTVYYDSADPSRGILTNGKGLRIAGKILLAVTLALGILTLVLLRVL